jgi:hypothetical protein
MIFVNNHVTCNLQFLNALTTYVQWLLWSEFLRLKLILRLI